MTLLCTSYLCAQLLLGVSRESEPPAGTWWIPDRPHSFQKFGFSYGLALTGRGQYWTDGWSLSLERLGRAGSSAVACSGDFDAPCAAGTQPYSHWLGSERPRGLWAAWEPHARHLLAQGGLGVVWPDFRMVVPDYVLGPGRIGYAEVGNNHALLSPLVGIGWRFRDADALLNWRHVRTANAGTGLGSFAGDFQGLGWEELDLALRVRF